MIWGMPSALYPAYADRLHPFLVNFAERSHERTTAIELAEKIRSRDLQIWVAEDFKAVCLTSVFASHVEINFCAGTEREKWQDALEAEIAAWARLLGKDRVIIIARPGWSKWAKAKGYTAAHIELVKELADGR